MSDFKDDEDGDFEFNPEIYAYDIDSDAESVDSNWSDMSNEDDDEKDPESDDED